MADIIKTTNSLRLDFIFVDGDTRALTVKNPKSNTVVADLLPDLNTFIQTNNLIIGDKNGGTFGRIKTATRITETKRIYDPAELI